MPDFWSHRYAAREALEQFYKTEPIHFIWSDNEEPIFIFGAQGPDFFYYINKWKPLSKVRYKHLGNAIHHDHPEPLIRILLEQLLTGRSKVQMAYIAGFLSHYLMDVHCHPLICRLGPDSDTHKRIEMDLEALCIFDYWGQTRSSLDIDALKIQEPAQMEALSELWASTLGRLDLEVVSTEAIKDGHLSMLRIQKLIKGNLLDYLPGKKLLGKIVDYDLTLLTYPDLETGALRATREYDTFVRDYDAGMAETANAFAFIEEIMSGRATVDAFIHRFVTKDFLGEAL